MNSPEVRAERKNMDNEKVNRIAQKIVDWQVDCNHLLKDGEGNTAPVVPFSVAKRIIAEELADSILITREQLDGIEWASPNGNYCPVCRRHKTEGHTEVCWIFLALGEKK